MDETMSIIRSLPWYAWVAIVAVICGTLSSVARRMIRHRERMAMIEQGMHPDYPDGKKRAGIEAPFEE